MHFCIFFSSLCMFTLQVWMRRVKMSRGKPAAGQLVSSSTRWTTWMGSSTSTAWTARPSSTSTGRHSTNRGSDHKHLHKNYVKLQWLYILLHTMSDESTWCCRKPLFFWLEHMHYRHVKTLLARRERYIAVYGSGWNKSLLSGSPWAASTEHPSLHWKCFCDR